MDRICLLYDIKYQIVCDYYLKYYVQLFYFYWDWGSFTERMVTHPLSIPPFSRFLNDK